MFSREYSQDWSGATLEDEKDSPIGPYRYAKTLGEQEVWEFTKGKPFTVRVRMRVFACVLVSFCLLCNRAE